MLDTKIDFISDIHVDSHRQDILRLGGLEKFVLAMLPQKIGDILIISGDVSETINDVVQFLKLISIHYKQVFYVYGNHEMYLGEKESQEFYGDTFLKLDELKKQVSKINNCFYLDGFEKQKIILDNGLSISGLCMFWDYSGTSLAHHTVNSLYRKAINDNKFIKFGSKNLNPNKFFKNQQKKLKKLEEVDILVTHYPPVKPPGTSDDILSTFFYFDGEEDLKRLNTKVCFYGHDHKQHDFEVNGTRLISNPFGYPSERTETKNKRDWIQSITLKGKK